MQTLISDHSRQKPSLHRCSVSNILNLRPLNATEAKLKSGVFQSLNVSDVRRFCRAARPGKLKRYEVLLKAGQENQTLYLILSGACLTRLEKSFFAEVDQAHFVGEMSFFTGQPVSVDIVARGNVEYLAWDHADLAKVFSRRPGLRSRFYQLLGTHMANRLNCVTEKLRAS